MIDYAHNAMALESLLDTLRDYHPERIVTVFGCGGNRSKTRRYEMGEVSGKLSDFTIITSDNPRFEEPQAIIDDIVVGMKRQMVNISPSVTEKKQLNMQSNMAGREMSSSWQEKDMRHIRKSRVSSMIWMNVF